MSRSRAPNTIISGMIAPGNHVDSDSLRGAPLPCVPLPSASLGALIILSRAVGGSVQERGAIVRRLGRVEPLPYRQNERKSGWWELTSHLLGNIIVQVC